MPGCRGASSSSAATSSSLRIDSSATLYALNAGLDIFYITGGLLLFALGATMDPREPIMEGTGIACASQGVFLLGYDLVSWALSLGRASDAAGVVP